MAEHTPNWPAWRQGVPISYRELERVDRYASDGRLAESTAEQGGAETMGGAMSLGGQQRVGFWAKITGQPSPFAPFYSFVEVQQDPGGNYTMPDVDGGLTGTGSLLEINFDLNVKTDGSVIAWAWESEAAGFFEFFNPRPSVPSLTITDGTHTVTDATSLDFVGATVSGSGGSATATVNPPSLPSFTAFSGYSTGNACTPTTDSNTFAGSSGKCTITWNKVFDYGGFLTGSAGASIVIPSIAGYSSFFCAVDVSTQVGGDNNAFLTDVSEIFLVLYINGVPHYTHDSGLSGHYQQVADGYMLANGDFSSLDATYLSYSGLVQVSPGDVLTVVAGAGGGPTMPNISVGEGGRFFVRILYF